MTYASGYLMSFRLCAYSFNGTLSKLWCVFEMEKKKPSYHSASFDHLIQVCARNSNKEARSPWRLSRTEQERLVLDLLLEHVEMNKPVLWLFDE